MKVNLAHALHPMSSTVIYTSRLGNWIAVPFRVRMRISVIALLAISACGGPVAPSSSSSPSALTSPTGSSTLPCRLPAVLAVDRQGLRLTLGFATLPNGPVSVDGSDAIVEVGRFPAAGTSGYTPIRGTERKPVLVGGGGATYSAAAGRWLPARPEEVAPDGLHYVYRHPDGELHVVDVTTTADRKVANPNNLNPLAFTASGIYLTKSALLAAGLWRMDPSTLVITELVAPGDGQDWLAVTRGIAWGANSNGAMGGPAATQILRADVSNGRVTRPYQSPSGTSIALIAPDSIGGVLLILAGQPLSALYLRSDGTQRPVSIASDVTALHLQGPRQADGHGIWFLGNVALARFDGDSIRIAGPAIEGLIAPAGPCT